MLSHKKKHGKIMQGGGKMTIERTFQGLRISTIHKDQYVTMHYIGYSKKEAVRLFKEHLRGL